MSSLAFIPARIGSKSIPKKNLHKLGGKPLIKWCMQAALDSNVDEIVCSTDSEEIASEAEGMGIPVVVRPEGMRDGETYPIHEIVIEYLNERNDDPNTVVLIQPTSPFVTSEQINLAITRLDPSMHSRWASFQTISDIPHNFHAWNQRSFNAETGQVQFCFPDLRKTGFNKAHKPTLCKFGNLVATKTADLRTEGFFALPSKGHYIPWTEALDIDNLVDFTLAESLLKAGMIV
jgi:CMP-N,N'-diacetyllegionaminic acid synthase